MEMASKPKLYEPSARSSHVSVSVKGKVYVWGGEIEDTSKVKDGTLANSIELFDPYLEIWLDLTSTAGIPHPGLESAACTSFGGRMYVYGGRINQNTYVDVLSCLDLGTLAWSQLSPGENGPMRKIGAGMVPFHHDKLIVIGGFGFLTGPTQPGSSFVSTDLSDGRGWSNEIHVFDISQGIAIVNYLPM